MNESVTESIYATKRNVEKLEECWFYHSMDLPEIGLVHGGWDLRGRLDDYLGGVDISGKRVLDVGTASGFLTFEMEKKGAQVVSFDAENEHQIQIPIFNQHDPKQDAGQRLLSARNYLERMKNSYWLAHRLFDSNAKVVYGDIYKIPQKIGMFDVVLVSQILVHLRDPVGALIQAGVFSSDALIITEGVFSNDKPLQKLIPCSETELGTGWWILSTGLYKEVLGLMGFEITSLSTNLYDCRTRKRDIGVTTIVAKRKSI